MSVLVTDGDSRAALAAVRALGRAGIAVTASASEPSSMAGHSRFCGEMIRYPSPWDDPEGFQGFLRAESFRKDCRLLLPITDISMQLAAQTRESLAPAVRAALPNEEQVRRVQDKGHVLELAKQLNIACPTTHFLDDGSSVYELAQRIRYPAVLKPRISRFQTSEGWVRGTVEYAQDPDDLVKKYQASHARIPYPLIQERIEGEGRGVFLLLWNGKLKAAFCHRRLLEKPPSGGVSVLCESIPLDEHLVKQSLLLLNAMDWHGPAMVEFKLDRQNGQANLMEVNGRFWGSLQLAIDAGVNFPVLLYRLASGEDPTPQFEYTAGMKSRWLIGYLDHLLMRVATKHEPPQSLGPRESKFRAFLGLLNFFEPNLHDAIFRFTDVRPFVFECKVYARNRLRQLGHRFSAETRNTGVARPKKVAAKPAKTELAQRSGL
jgi:predicted ATP-grasp superfamily ATP-dependent carboligase